MRIAICDDEKKICAILAEKVGKICPGAEIMTYISGEKLLGADILPDILLLEIKMPGLSGMDVAKTLRDRDWRKILIFITGEEDQVFNSFDLHAFHFLVKPVADEKLKEVLENAVKERLFTWLKESMYHPLVKSCIFHYEFEFIHPFQDGNGRMGRLWQSLILQKWKDIFTWLPVETLVYENQEEYYKVLQSADNKGDSTEFVEFMLGMIRDALSEISTTQNENDVVTNVVINVVTNEDKVLSMLKQDGKMSATMLANSIGITQRQAQRILSKLKDEGKILRHGANKNGYWEVID